MNLIRRATNKDYGTLTNIWLESSRIAHDFIPSSYWEENKQAMENTYLPSSTVFVSELENTVVGFVALVESHIAAIFVHPNYQNRGIGFKLLEYIKAQHASLSLNVYKKNRKSTSFYLKHGFEITDEQIEQQTGETEFVMRWKS